MKGNRSEHAPAPSYRFTRKLSGYCFGISPVILCLALIWPFGGGKKVDMMAGNSTPAAHGEVQINKGDNGNRELDIKVSSLALPGALQPPANTYIVWLQEPGRDPHNMGQLHVNNNRDGQLKVVTAFQRFRIFITAEQNGQQHVPEGTEVLSADIPATS